MQRTISIPYYTIYSFTDILLKFITVTITVII